MKLLFHQKTVNTMIVKPCDSGQVFRVAGDNSQWHLLPNYLKKELRPLRPGNKESYEFLDFYEGMRNFLTSRYGLQKSGFMTYRFYIGSFEFIGRYTSNECNEPFLKVRANLPRKVLKDILWELCIEEGQYTK